MVVLEKMVRLDSGKCMKILSMNNFRYDLDIEIVKAPFKRIPCAFLTYLKILKQTLAYISK